MLLFNAHGALSKHCVISQGTGEMSHKQVPDQAGVGATLFLPWQASHGMSDKSLRPKGKLAKSCLKPWRSFGAEGTTTC